MGAAPPAPFPSAVQALLCAQDETEWQQVHTSSYALIWQHEVPLHRHRPPDTALHCLGEGTGAGSLQWRTHRELQ